MNSIESVKALLSAHESGEQIARNISKLLLDDEGTRLLEDKLEEATNTLMLRRQELSAPEREVLNIVENSDISLTADDVAGKATKRFLKYRNHASTVLGRLVEKGRIIRAGKNGGKILYSKKGS